MELFENVLQNQELEIDSSKLMGNDEPGGLHGSPLEHPNAGRDLLCIRTVVFPRSWRLLRLYSHRFLPIAQPIIQLEYASRAGGIDDLPPIPGSSHLTISMLPPHP